MFSCCQSFDFWRCCASGSRSRRLDQRKDTSSHSGDVCFVTTGCASPLVRLSAVSCFILGDRLGNESIAPTETWRLSAVQASTGHAFRSCYISKAWCRWSCCGSAPRFLTRSDWRITWELSSRQQCIWWAKKAACVSNEFCSIAATDDPFLRFELCFCCLALQIPLGHEYSSHIVSAHMSTVWDISIHEVNSTEIRRAGHWQLRIRHMKCIPSTWLLWSSVERSNQYKIKIGSDRFGPTWKEVIRVEFKLPHGEGLVLPHSEDSLRVLGIEARESNAQEEVGQSIRNCPPTGQWWHCQRFNVMDRGWRWARLLQVGRSRLVREMVFRGYQRGMEVSSSKREGRVWAIQRHTGRPPFACCACNLHSRSTRQLESKYDGGLHFGGLCWWQLAKHSASVQCGLEQWSICTLRPSEIVSGNARHVQKRMFEQLGVAWRFAQWKFVFSQSNETMVFYWSRSLQGEKDCFRSRNTQSSEETDNRDNKSRQRFRWTVACLYGMEIDAHRAHDE